MIHFKHPIWLAGFRPFFTLAFIAGAVLPLVWALLFTGRITLPHAYLSPVQWHAHEMLYGFAWAVLGGFLLTASKNWLKIRGIHGANLAIAVFFWLIERCSIALIAPQSIAGFISQNLFIVYVSFYLIETMLRFRKQDAFKDNYFFILMLIFFIIAKNLLLYLPTYSFGASMTLGLFRVAFVIMLGRTIPQFMKNAFAVTLYQNKFLEFSIKFCALASVFCCFLPPPIALGLLLVTAILLLIRLALWKPVLAFGKFEIALMYWGYLALCTHLIFEGLRQNQIFMGIGSLSVHIFTIFCMGLIIPGMLIRISQGHTGRKLVFTRSDRLAISFVIFAGLSRVLATQVAPQYYHVWIMTAAIAWSLCFILLGYRLIPFLWQARLDQKEH